MLFFCINLIVTPLAARSDFPLNIVLSNNATSECNYIQKKYDKNGRELERNEFILKIISSPRNLIYRMILEGNNIVDITYSKISNANYRLDPKLTLSGPDFEARSEDIQKIYRTQFLSALKSMPALEAKLPLNNIRIGDIVYKNPTREEFLDTMIKAFRSDAVQRSVEDTISVTGINNINGSESLLISGKIKADYITRGVWYTLQNKLKYFIDIKTGLTRKYDSDVEVWSNGNLSIQITQRANCKIDVIGDNVQDAGTKGGQQKTYTKEENNIKVSDISQRLQQLDKLLKDGLITKEEAAEKRKEILKDL